MEFNLLRCPGGGYGIPRTRAVVWGFRRAHFPRGERHDRFFGRHEPRRKVALLREGVIDAGGGPVGGPRISAAVGALGGFRPFDWEGLLAVLSDRGCFLAWLPPASSRVSGESVGTLSDPS